MQADFNKASVRIRDLTKNYSSRDLQAKPKMKGAFRSEVEKEVSLLAKSHIEETLQVASPLARHTAQASRESSLFKLLDRSLTDKQVQFSEEHLQALSASKDSNVQHLRKILESRKLLEENFPADRPGASVVITQNGEIVDALGLGLADMSGTPRTPDSRQHFASVSKQFTAMCILMLDDDFKMEMKLDDDIRTHLPDLPRFIVRDPGGSKREVTITIDHLLHMNSGLLTSGPYEHLIEKEKDEDDVMTTRDDMGMLNNPELETFVLPFEPGGKPTGGHDFSYSNIGYELLSEIIEKVSGKTILEYAEENIFEPLQMDNTHIIDPDRPILEQTIRGYNVDEQGVPTESTPKHVIWGATGVIGTARDMAKWENFIATNPKARRLLELMPGRTVVEGGKFQYARGIFLYDESDYRFIFHSGCVSGFRTEFLHLEPKDSNKDSVGIFLAANYMLTGESWDNFQQLTLDIVKIWTGATALGKLPDFDRQALEDIHLLWEEGETPLDEPQRDINIETLKPFVGKYYCPTLRASYEMELKYGEDNKLKGLAMYVIKGGVTSNKSRFIFVPDPENEGQLEWDKSVKFDFDARIRLSKEGFIYSDLNWAIAELSFEKED